MTKRTRPHLIAIGSGKGGTGKTFASVSLAQALSSLGERVLLCDADIGLANTTVQLGLDDGGDLASVVATGRLEPQCVRPVNGGAREPGGFDLLAAPAGSGALADLAVESASRLIAALRGAHAYDRVVLDLAAGVDAVTVNFAAAAEECLLVMTPDPSALADAYAFFKLVLRRGGRGPVSLVNMAAGQTEARRVADSLARTARAFLKETPRFLGAIPRDARVLEAIRYQKQPLVAFPESPASHALRAIAESLHGPLQPARAFGATIR
jgi:flagellar biosynthesis protein FlhG